MTDLFIGALSGTSMDAIDVALIEFNKNEINLIAAKNYPLPSKFKDACKKIAANDNCNINEFGQLDHQCGMLFANAINDFLASNKIKKSQIKAIGSHGQTLKHQPALEYPFTMQIGDPNIIAYHTKIPVVADFRRKDMAAGGQGAPFAPLIHNEIFRDTKKNRIIINIGGISNITILPKVNSEGIKGYDTGPGNCLIDYWSKNYFHQPFDKDGKIAASGNLDKKLLNKFLEDEFFEAKPPKSTGTDYFNINWLKKFIPEDLTASQVQVDILNTLTHLTAQTIANCIKKEGLSNPEAYICGGGANNKFLFDLIKKYTKINVYPSTEVGLNPDWVEATLFAYLAKKRFYSEKIELNTITGAKKATTLGGLYNI